MGFPTGSPKMYAEDIARGFVRVNVSNLRRFSQADLRVLHVNIKIVSRETRQIQPDEGDFDGVRNKNQMLQRLKSANLVIENYCKRRRIPLGG